jgi:hypothetical protein
MGDTPSDVETIGPTNTEQIPIAISDFKAKGVNLVIFACNPGLIGPFVEAAGQSDFTPTWELSSFNSESADAEDSYLPSSFDGTVGFAQDPFATYNAGAPLDAQDQACKNIVGPADPTVGNPSGLVSQSASIQVAFRECGTFDAFVAGAEKAGSDLTQQTLVSSIESLGSVPLARMLGGSFAPGKPDYADTVMQIIWHVSCHCWLPASGQNTHTMAS